MSVYTTVQIHPFLSRTIQFRVAAAIRRDLTGRQSLTEPHKQPCTLTTPRYNLKLEHAEEEDCLSICLFSLKVKEI